MLTERILFERVEKWLSPIYWSNINLHSVLYRETQPITPILVYEPPYHERPHISTIIQQQQELFVNPTNIGASFTPSWSTKWFKFQVDFSSFGTTAKPEEGVTIGILWDSNSEALLYSEDGVQIQSFTGGQGGDRRDLCLLSPSHLNHLPATHTFFIEMACNEMFGNGNNGMIQPPNPSKSFTLSDLKLVLINTHAYDLYWDLIVMCDLVKSLPSTSPTHSTLLSLMNLIINRTNVHENLSLQTSHQLALNFFHGSPSSPAACLPSSASTASSSPQCKVNHDIYAFGHCHIDTAWLWPYVETRRKVARSWATQLHLMDSYPEFHFVASQTVQYEWLLEDHPTLFNRIKEAVREGSFIPIGGTYVEFDANLPSGESMVRQFLYGMDFLKSHFDVTPKTFWLPDTFGYSSQLPQIMKGFGMEYFLSQKLSWNLINKLSFPLFLSSFLIDAPPRCALRFPHNTLEWRGLDGSAVIAHFPPADNYGSEANPSDLIKTVENNKSK
jgi:alpha-mannosidase